MEQNKVENLAYPTKLSDGIYVEYFVVTYGMRYNAKIIPMSEVAQTLTGSLMDGIEKLWKETQRGMIYV